MVGCIRACCLAHRSFSFCSNFILTSFLVRFLVPLVLLGSSVDLLSIWISIFIWSCCPSLGTHQLHDLGFEYVIDMFSVIYFWFFHFQLLPDDNTSISIQCVCPLCFCLLQNDFGCFIHSGRKSNSGFCVLMKGSFTHKFAHVLSCTC